MMHIWVDADACPKAIKEILFKAAVRKQVSLTLVSNQPMRVPHSKYIMHIQVPGGFDVADEHIAEQVQASDLVITADIPLAAEIVNREALALTPRGRLYNKENIVEALTMRNLKEELRSAGIETGGPASFHQSDRAAFANQLDKILTK